jgi:integrase
MATVNFRIRPSVSEYVNIKVVLSIGTNQVYEAKTGFAIKPNNWNVKSKLPKQSGELNKQISNALHKLKDYILRKLNNDNSKGVEIDSNWLNESVMLCFNRIDPNKRDENSIISHTLKIIENAHLRQIRGTSQIGLSFSSIKVYKSFVNLFLRYEKQLKRTISFMDIDKQFIENFKRWLLTKENYSVNHSGKQIQILKTVCNDADKLGVEVNRYAKHIEKFSENDEDRNIVTLTSDEIDLIHNVELNKPYLENARKWILIACQIGQRGEDLLRLTVESFRLSEKELFVDVFQRKTKKYVTAVIYDKRVRKIVLNEFPHKISSQKLNDYSKEVCRLAGVNQVVRAKSILIDDNNRKRRIVADLPKYNFISTHCFRRTFATNFYKRIETPILMEITGHTKESTFLKYINKSVDKDRNAELFVQSYKKLKK